jgi:hypothetical protein
VQISSLPKTKNNSLKNTHFKVNGRHSNGNSRGKKISPTLSLSQKKGGGGRGERRKASRLVTRAAATCDFEWKLLLRG